MAEPLSWPLGVLRLNSVVTTTGIFLKSTMMDSNGAQYCFEVSELRYGKAPAANTGKLAVVCHSVWAVGLGLCTAIAGLMIDR